MLTIIAALIGLAIAGVIFWDRNPDVELKVPESISERIAELVPPERPPDSFAEITATNTPLPTTSPPSVTRRTQPVQAKQRERTTPQAIGGSGAESRAQIESETTEKVAQLEVMVHAGINKERARNGGVRPLQWDERLATVARAHSEDMASRNYFSHDSPEGLGPSDRARRAGYSCRKSSHVGLGENISIEFASNNLDEVALEAVRSWMNSPGHRFNLLDSQFHRTGVGAAYGKWRGYNAVYFTQVFC